MSFSSAFGASEGWDDLFEGIETGWRYFLQNLRIYLEKHAGRTRRMISERLEATMPRQAFWKHLLSGATGLVVGGAAALKAGDTIQVRLSDEVPARAVVELVVEGHALGLRLADLADSLLFIEMEGKSGPFHVGYWLSVYDEAVAKRLDAPAREVFRRIHESPPKD